jgi:hypothetical protein
MSGAEASSSPSSSPASSGLSLELQHPIAIPKTLVAMAKSAAFHYINPQNAHTAPRLA